MDTSGPGEKQHEPPASSHAQASPSPQMTLPTHFVVPSTTGGGRDRRVDASLHPRVLVTPSHQGSIPATSTSSGQVGGGATAHCKVSGVQWSDTYSPYKREEGDYSSTSEILIKAVPPSATTTTPSSLLQPSTSSPYTSIISSSSSYPHPTATKYISDSTEGYRLVSSSYYPSYTYSSTPGLRVVEEESSASQTTRPNAKTISSSNTLVPPPPSSSSSSPLLSSPSPLPHKTISTSVYTPPASTIPAAVAYTPSTLTPPPAVSRTYVVEESSPTVYYTQQILTDEKPVLPLREVCRYTEACTLPDPSPYYEEPLIMVPARRRRRRKIRGCGDCGFCRDCAIPCMDAFVTFLSALLLPCEGNPSISSMLQPPPDPASSMLVYHSGGRDPSHLLGSPPQPTVDTVCLKCGDIVESDKVDDAVFVDMVTNGGVTSSYASQKLRGEQDEASGKIPLPVFSYHAPRDHNGNIATGSGGKHDQKGRHSGGENGDLDFEELRDDGSLGMKRGMDSQSYGSSLQFPRDEKDGRVALPAFRLEETDQSPGKKKMTK